MDNNASIAAKCITYHYITYILTWKKSCTVTQTRSGTQVSSTTKTESTTGGETDATVSSIDFGTTYQSGDSVTAACKVVRTITATGATSDLTSPAPKSTTETMVAQDKTITLS